MFYISMYDYLIDQNKYSVIEYIHNFGSKKHWYILVYKQNEYWNQLCSNMVYIVVLFSKGRIHNEINWWIRPFEKISTICYTIKVGE